MCIGGCVLTLQAGLGQSGRFGRRCSHSGGVGTGGRLHISKGTGWATLSCCACLRGCFILGPRVIAAEAIPMQPLTDALQPYGPSEHISAVLSSCSQLLTAGLCRSSCSHAVLATGQSFVFQSLHVGQLVSSPSCYWRPYACVFSCRQTDEVCGCFVVPSSPLLLVFVRGSPMFGPVHVPLRAGM